MVGNNNKIYNCGDYLRLSKEDIGRNDESSSIQSQRMIIEGFAKHNNLNIVKEYVDDGYSGGNFDRPAFRQMIEDIENGLINCVITKDLSRLGREMYKTGKYIEEYFLEHNIRYIAINDSYDSNIGDSMLGLRLGVNDLYLRDVSKKVRSSFRVKQEKGEYIGSFPCYGYMKNPEDKHKLIIDPVASKVVKMIYDLYLEGLGVTKICRKLTDEKIAIPIVYKKEPRGLAVTENDGFGVWKNATVRNILKSQMYIGNMVQHTHEKISYRAKKCRHLSEDNFIIVENTHEAIISKEDFDEVQKMLKNKSYTPKEKNLDRFLFSGMMFCGKCGHTLGVSVKKTKSKPSLYTHCNHYLRKGKQSECTPNRLNYHLLEQDITHYLNEIGEEFIKHYDLRNMVEDSVYIYNRDIEELEKQLEEINRKMEKKINIISNLYNDKLEEVISLEVYKNLSDSHEKELQQLKIEKEDKENRLKVFADKSKEKEFTKCREAVEKFMKLKTPSRSTVKNLIDRIVVYDNGDSKEVIVYFKFKELEYLASNLV
jgi:hypothetical protein